MTTPSYNGAANQSDPLVTPWYIMGWTAQAIAQDTVPVANNGISPPPLPANLVYVEVTSMYVDFDGNPLSGFLTFMMSEGITVTSNNATYRLPARLAGRDNTQLAGGINNWGSGRIYIRNGLVSVTLMTTGNPAIVTDSGNPLTYHVVEHFLGGRQFDLAIPDSAVTPTDLSTLIIPGSVQAASFDPTNVAGNEGYVPIAPALAVPVQSSAPTDIDGGSA